MAVKNKGRFWYGFARTTTQGFSALTATNKDEYAFWAAPFACKIVRCGVIFDDDVTGAATDNFGLRFKNKGPDGSGTAVIVTKTFSSGVDASQFDFIDFGSVSNNKLNAGDTLTFEKFENNSGANMPGVVAYIEYVKHR